MFRHHRMPRRKANSTIVRRQSDGTLWCAWHDGQAAAMASMFGNGHQFSFRRVRQYAGKYIASRRVAWRHSDGKFEILESATVTMVG